MRRCHFKSEMLLRDLLSTLDLEKNICCCNADVVSEKLKLQPLVNIQIYSLLSKVYCPLLSLVSTSSAKVFVVDMAGAWSAD